MARPVEYSTLSGSVERTTDRAVLFTPAHRADAENLDVHFGDSKWIPKSVLRDGDSVEEGDTDIDVAKWWVDKQLA